MTDRPPPSLRQVQLVHFLSNLLAAYLDLRPIGQVIPAPFAMRLSANGAICTPDVQVILHEHRDRLNGTHVAGPADLIVDVRPAGATKRDRDRAGAYARAGVPEYWAVDPVRQQARFSQLAGPSGYEPVPLGNPPLFRSTVLPGFYLAVDLLWRDPLPSLQQTLELAFWMHGGSESSPIGEPASAPSSVSPAPH